MACWLNEARQGETVSAEKKQRAKEALERLKRALAGGIVKVVIDPRTGAVAFRGVWRSDGVADTCAYRALTAENSPELRAAVQRAQVTAGRAVNPQAVSAGTHSHDGGRTFSPGHSH